MTQSLEVVQKLWPQMTSTGSSSVVHQLSANGNSALLVRLFEKYPVFMSKLLVTPDASGSLPFMVALYHGHLDATVLLLTALVELVTAQKEHKVRNSDLGVFYGLWRRTGVLRVRSIEPDTTLSAGPTLSAGRARRDQQLGLHVQAAGHSGSVSGQLLATVASRYVRDTEPLSWWLCITGSVSRASVSRASC